MFAHPEMIERTCARCEAYFYEDGLNKMGPLMLLDDGSPMPRPRDGDRPGETPCHQCPKVPRDAPSRTREFAVDPSEKSLAALRHYQRCKTTGVWPADEIVFRNAELIGPVEKVGDIASAGDAAGVIALLLASGGKRG